jgi:O-antigen/teichoic acid export membrane protein
MSQIRRKSIISSLLVYIGFVLGFINTYLFTKQGGFTQQEYGLVGIFMALASLLFSVANVGMPPFITKFFPYYKANLPAKQNDMLSIALLLSTIGYGLVTVAGVYFKDIIILKFGKNSPQLITYYYWLFPFGFGLSLYTILESYAWQLNQSVITTYLREIQFRLLSTILIVLVFVGVIHQFDVFVKLFSFTYLVIAILLITYLAKKGNIHFTTTISRVTKKFYKKIIVLVSFVFGGTVLYGISLIFDSVVIASVLPQGLAAVAVFTLGQYMANLIQAPQRGILASAMGPLSQAWKDKDLARIDNIYKQSSINQLIFATGIFCLLWLNFTDGIITFKLQTGYLQAKWVFFFVGLYRIVDMGTGLNAQIIATSIHWRFEFFTGIILLLLTLPLTYFLTKMPTLGILGPPIASLISFSVYNAVRYWFLLHKYKLQPFTIKTLYTIIVALSSYLICHYLFGNHTGIIWMCARSSLFLLLFTTGVLQLKLSKDVLPVWNTIVKKTGLQKIFT